MSIEKAQQYDELSTRVTQLETTLWSLHQQASMQQTSPKEPKICFPGKFEGNRSQFRGFLNQVCLVFHMQPNRYPTDAAQQELH